MAESRQLELQRSKAIRVLQRELERQSPVIDVFDPFNSVCPPAQASCRTYAQGQLLFSDGNHLTSQGALRLYGAFSRFLAET